VDIGYIGSLRATETGSVCHICGYNIKETHIYQYGKIFNYCCHWEFAG
jgi:hypothetical protein